MAEMVYQRARREAQKIRDLFEVGPDGLGDLKKIARALGAVVYVSPLDPDLAGFIIREKGDEFTSIFINRDDSAERQRFTLAHEIGHLVDRQRVALDLEYSFTDYRDFRDGENNEKGGLHEFFANEFAGSLLMPAVPFLRAYKNQGPEAAAREFGVSISAVEDRLRRLITHHPEELAA